METKSALLEGYLVNEKHFGLSVTKNIKFSVRVWICQLKFSQLIICHYFYLVKYLDGKIPSLKTYEESDHEYFHLKL